MNWILIVLAGLMWAGSSGCGSSAGPDMGLVSGVVTMDGKPLADAVVKFAPQGTGSMTSGGLSFGVTNAEGRYELDYSATKKGAVIGTHLVTISTQRSAGEDEEGNPLPAVKESVPVEYNVSAAGNPDMRKDVKAGRNEMNFELKGGGKIVQRPNEDSG